MYLELKYSSGVVVPHPLKYSAGGAHRQLLNAMVDPGSIRDDLEEIQRDGASSEEYDMAVLTASDYIGAQVREALWYPEKTIDRDDFKRFDVDIPVDLSALKYKQIASCFGFTLVTSEILDASAIDHYVGFVNGHTAILLPTADRKKLHLVDPLTPSLSQNLRFSMLSGDTIEEDVRAHGKSAVELNTYTIAKRASGGTQETIEENPWLTYEPRIVLPTAYRALPMGREQYFDEEGGGLNPQQFKAYMSVYMPQDGRYTIAKYNEFRLAYKARNYLGAAACLKALKGKYPDVDARREQPEIREVMMNLSQRGKTKIAKEALSAVFDSFMIVSNDSRFPSRHGDFLRVIGREGHDISAARQAVLKYEAALEYPHAYKDTVTAKLAKARDLVTRLQVEKGSSIDTAA